MKTFLTWGRNRHPGSRSTERPNKMNTKRTTPRHIIVTVAKVKDRILKAAKEKQHSHTREISNDNQLILFFSRNFASQKGVAAYI